MGYLKGFLIAILINFVAAFPGKLLRVPKIYNALITSKEKILPSEAYPAGTGPIFQPIGLSPGTFIIQPEIIVEGAAKPEDFHVQEGDRVKMPFDSMKNSRLMFFPRYSVYYAYQPHLLVPQPFVYTAFETAPLIPLNVRDGVQKSQSNSERDLENDERKDLSFQNSKINLRNSPPKSREFFKNNRPSNRNIPDVQPSPPPSRYRVDEEDEEEAR